MPETLPGQQVSAATPQASRDRSALAGLPGGRKRRRMILWLFAAAVVLAGAGVGLAVSDPFSAGGTSQPGVSGSADPTSLYTVQRGTISSQISVSATLGYGGSYTVVNQARDGDRCPGGGPGGEPGPGALPGEWCTGRPPLRLDPGLPHAVLGPDRRGRRRTQRRSGRPRRRHQRRDPGRLGRRSPRPRYSTGEAPGSARRNAERHADPRPGRLRARRVPGHHGLGHPGRAGAARPAGHVGHLDHPSGHASP